MSTGVRPARSDEMDQVIEIFAWGFAEDPLWGHWTFPDAADRVAQLRRFWAPYVLGTAKYDGVIVLDDLAAVALWVPPGVPDLDADDEAIVAEMQSELFGADSPRLDACWEQFGVNRPSEPHWYLSLLATAPDRRGSGLGMHLVAEHLRRVDAEGVPSYLESTNPGNLARYGRAGYELIGHFDVPTGPRVDRMWRPLPTPQP